MLTNNVTKKRYIGKSSNLLDRFLNYSSQNSLKNHPNSLIGKALLKFGFSNFSLTILDADRNLTQTGKEHYESTLNEKEQYFINLLKPQYNIRKSVVKPPKSPKRIINSDKSLDKDS